METEEEHETKLPELSLDTLNIQEERTQEEKDIIDSKRYIKFVSDKLNSRFWHEEEKPHLPEFNNFLNDIQAKLEKNPAYVRQILIITNIYSEIFPLLHD